MWSSKSSVHLLSIYVPRCLSELYMLPHFILKKPYVISTVIISIYIQTADTEIENKIAQGHSW